MNILYYLAISFICSLVAFISSNSLIVSLITFALGILYFFLVFDRLNKKDRVPSLRYHECYLFINSFIISLSIKDSLIFAFENSTLKISSSFENEIESISHLPVNDKLKYLEKYFDFDVYKLFIQTLIIYQDQGGNILDISKHLLNELRNIEEYLIEIEESSKRKVIELVILWIFTIFILCFMRFGLSSFFATISNELFFKLGVIIFFVFLFISIEVSRRAIFKSDIAGWKNEEN